MGYPTKKELKKITEWAGSHFELINFVHSIWHWPDFIRKKWRGTGNKWFLEVTISTGGWSGNESIIHALQGNFIFWALCWFQSTRGGHYVFHVQIPPEFMLVSDYCLKNGISKQAIYQAKEKYEWIKVSDNKRFVKKKP